ncbi:BatA domain-containing protein [Hymenobacter cheonanensis]|uniref:BatA domain-containing protein n=1 Tax=Hymenobacter sp. CA2-7 TaxID=3063993 RepID=UPI0027140B34|nr:BatA domain-containing protein [Hymenobacter sp. CA2-7]MDO7884545.1 BatA domain-containing protein [Hymenobacter sp. CA2-7]
MLTLANPSALLALLGLLVPLAIHLWNRRPGREVAVGSLRWLAAGANRRLRNLRLEQVGLLLLRAALLAALAVALAGPQWRQPQPAGRGQVLVSRELADGSSLAAVRPALDSLRRRGYQLRWLAAGLPAITPAEWQADSLGRKNAKGNSLTDNRYWARIQQAADAYPGQPLYAVTPASLRALGGAHPALPASLTWQTIPARAATTWLQAAAASADSLRLLLGQSNEKQTTYRVVRVARPQPGTTLAVAGLPPLRYETTAGQPQLRPVAADSAQVSLAVPVRTGALRVVVFAPAGAAEEARYLRAALRAAAVGLPAPLALTISTTEPDPAGAPDWLFWLGDSPVPAAWRARVPRGLHLWQEAAGAGLPDTATLATAETAADAPIVLTRRGRLALPAGSYPRWADGRGQAVLAETRQGQGASYLLATRLQPTWSTLSASPALPALLLDLLATNPQLGTDSLLTAYDQRRLDPAQLPTRPVRLAGSRAAAPTAYRFTDLRPWLVLLAALLLGLERWLAQRRAASPLLAIPSL